MTISPFGEKSFALILKDLTVSGWAVKWKSILFLKNWKEQQMRGETWKRCYSYCSSQMHGRNGMKRWAKRTTRKNRYNRRKNFMMYFKKPNQYSPKIPLSPSSAVSETFVGKISALTLPTMNKRGSKASSQILQLWKMNI